MSRVRQTQGPYRLGVSDRAEFLTPLLVGVLVASLLFLAIVFHFGSGVS